MKFDLVIRRGQVVDGTGRRAYPADVGIAADRIAAIGRIPELGREEIDAEGQVVTTHDGEFVAIRDDWADDGVMAIELVHRHVERSAPRPNGSFTTTMGDLEEALYLLWTEGEPVVIDLSDEVGPSLFGCDGVTGDVEALDSSAVIVTSVPQVVSVTDAYFDRE